MPLISSRLSRLFIISTSKKPLSCTVVIAAAGSSQRCKGEDKLFYNIDGKPILAYSIEAFQNCLLVDDIIIVTRHEQLMDVTEICLKYNYDKVSNVLCGGKTRTESVMNGVFAASKKAKLIAVHDGARPCVSNEIIEKTIKSAAKYLAAAPAAKVTSTLKRVYYSNNNSIVSKTVDRDDLYEIQTPQIFRAEIIKAALTYVTKKSIEITDDCMAVELIGAPVHIVDSPRSNIKVTEIEDLLIAEALLTKKI